MVIRGGGCKCQPWCISCVKTVEGKEFVELSRRHSGFCRFVAGESSLRGSQFLDDLRHKRTAATLESCSSGTRGSEGALFDDGAVSRRDHKKQRKETQQKLAKGEAPAVIKLNMPEVQTEDGVVGPLSIQVLPDLNPQQNVWVEASAQVLEYIRHAHANSDPKVQERRERTDGGVRWRTDRKAFLATRWSASRERQIVKTFRPTGEADEQIEEAKTKAAMGREGGVGRRGGRVGRRARGR